MNSVAFAAQSTSARTSPAACASRRVFSTKPAREPAAFLEVGVGRGLGVDAFYVQDRVQRGQARLAFAQLGEAHDVAQ